MFGIMLLLLEDNKTKRNNCVVAGDVVVGSLVGRCCWKLFEVWDDVPVVGRQVGDGKFENPSGRCDGCQYVVSGDVVEWGCSIIVLLLLWRLLCV